jgi:diamine N-acetyltransferase
MQSLATLRPAKTEDIAFIMATEAVAGQQGFVSVWSRAEHEHAIAQPDFRYLIIEERGAPRGYAILRGVSSSDRNLELKRIVVSDPGKGIGRAAMQKLLAWAFLDHLARRVWLDVYEDNTRARRFYESLGFRLEPVLPEPEPYLHGHSLFVMAILEGDYRGRSMIPPAL